MCFPSYNGWNVVVMLEMWWPVCAKIFFVFLVPGCSLPQLPNTTAGPCPWCTFLYHFLRLILISPFHVSLFIANGFFCSACHNLCSHTGHMDVIRLAHDSSARSAVVDSALQSSCGSYLYEKK